MLNKLIKKEVFGAWNRRKGCAHFQGKYTHLKGKKINAMHDQVKKGEVI